MEKYEVVKQDDGYFTIFDGMEQYCDEEGTPIRYDTYEEAQEDCDILNEVPEDIWYDKISEQL